MNDPEKVGDASINYCVRRWEQRNKIYIYNIDIILRTSKKTSKEASKKHQQQNRYTVASDNTVDTDGESHDKWNVNRIKFVTFYKKSMQPLTSFNN